MNETAFLLTRYLREHGFFATHEEERGMMGGVHFTVSRLHQNSLIHMEIAETRVFGLGHPVDLHDPESFDKILKVLNTLLP